MLAILGGGAFMFWAAGHYTVFDDEAFSCRRYVMPAGEMVSALWHGAEPDPPLYYLLENAWVRVFGVGPLGLRSLSILFFLIGLPFVRLAGRAWFDRQTGLAAMLLCVLHPAHLFFGFAARWYSLMFLMVAVLLWLTARLSAAERSAPQYKAFPWVLGASVLERVHKGARRLAIAWAFAAAGMCYTNYFGPVLVGLVWLVGVLHSRRKAGGVRRWVWGGSLAIVLYAAWLVPFFRQATSFPEVGGSWTTYAATAARTMLALTTGNLASIRAWWVLVPMTLFGIGVVVLLVQQWRAVWPIAVITLGCFVAGVASRTMIDKYVMAFSGAACLLVAALLVRGAGIANSEWRMANGERPKASSEGRTACGLSRIARWGTGQVAARVTVVCLIVGWAGCGVNLVTQRHWSSLRWLDPFKRVIDDLVADQDAPPPMYWVVTHPSGRYYHGCAFAARSGGGRPELPAKVDRCLWRSLADLPAAGRERHDAMAATPETILPFVEKSAVPALVTIQTAGFAELPDWASLQAALDRNYVVAETRAYLEDPDAAWKDRLDPDVRHPRWRIVVRRWELREG
ncbi:MAG: hypothetical protein JXQ75_21815 [Phycisphaerae bacterium]|nr:hypothetical protein [Phycisphaerae bacterium]